MSRSFWQKLDLMARQMTPFALTVVLVIVGLIPLPVPDYALVAPQLAFVAVYFWALHRPHLLPAYAVFIVGLLQDALSGMPVGVNVLVLLTIHGVVLSQRRFFIGKSFAIAWLGFAIVAAVAFLETWILISVLDLAVVNAAPVAVQYPVTVGVFPLVAWFFYRWHQAYLVNEA
jgi:rod shape-determining protein MreD